MYAEMLGPGQVAELRPPSPDGVELMYSDEYVAKRMERRKKNRRKRPKSHAGLYAYVDNNPIRHVDPSGKDIYLEEADKSCGNFCYGSPCQGSAGNLFHMRVCVDLSFSIDAEITGEDPGRYCQSFKWSGTSFLPWNGSYTPANGWLGWPIRNYCQTCSTGIVYSDPDAPGFSTHIVAQKATTPSQDQQFYLTLMYRLGKIDAYSAFQMNCRRYSREEFKGAPGTLLPPAAPPPDDEYRPFCSPPFVCFASGTTVATPSGPRAIEGLEVDDPVLAYDLTSEQTVVSQVQRIVDHSAEEVCMLDVDGEVIRVTEEHPFYVVGQGWKKAADLDTSDLLLTDDGKRVSVEEVRRMKEQVQVFNLTVSGQHNFFVGTSRILVHNKIP